MAQYAELFRANDIDAEILRGMTAEDLKDLGIAFFGHRRWLTSAIAEWSIFMTMRDERKQV